MTLREVAFDIIHRMESIFLRNPEGRRPVCGGAEKFQSGSWPIALVIFIASVFVPLLTLFIPGGSGRPVFRRRGGADHARRHELRSAPDLGCEGEDA
jgi:hypothetical protein